MWVIIMKINCLYDTEDVNAVTVLPFVMCLLAIPKSTNGGLQ